MVSVGARECVYHLGVVPLGPRRGHLCGPLVRLVGVRQGSKASSSPPSPLFLFSALLFLF